MAEFIVKTIAPETELTLQLYEYEKTSVSSADISKEELLNDAESLGHSDFTKKWDSGTSAATAISKFYNTAPSAIVTTNTSISWATGSKNICETKRKCKWEIDSQTLPEEALGPTVFEEEKSI